MLSLLNVKNITVIESANLEFGPGLNVITGETGAGKSVLIGALKFLMGERFNKAVLRDNSQKMSVEALFYDVSCIDKELRETFEIENELSLSRQSDDAGRNKVLINGMVAPVIKLKEIGEFLVDIHGQHEHQLLFNKEKHLEIIDFFVSSVLKNAFLSDYEIYKKKEKELSVLKKNSEDTLKMIDIYSFQLEEIDSMEIDFDKDSKIEVTLEFLSNIEKIREATAQCIDLLKDGEINAGDLIGRAERFLTSVVSSVPELTKAEENLNGAASLIDDAVAYIESAFAKQETDPEDLNKLIDRKFKLANLIKKYGGTLEAVIDYKLKIENELNNFENYSGILATLEKETEILKDRAQKSALKLNEARKKASSEISMKVIDILKELELPQCKFEARFTDEGFLDRKGGVTAEFFISTNAGFEPGPLGNIASGGEISRVMLALKEVFGEADGVGTMVFDEIDTGISGKAAKSVAEKLKKLGTKKQIIVITHLPVVAAMGTTHFHITKSDEGGKSVTKIEKIDKKERIEALAVMISGSVTDASLTQAGELLLQGK